MKESGQVGPGDPSWAFGKGDTWKDVAENLRTEQLSLELKLRILNAALRVLKEHCEWTSTYNKRMMEQITSMESVIERD